MSGAAEAGPNGIGRRRAVACTSARGRLRPAYALPLWACAGLALLAEMPELVAASDGEATEIAVGDAVPLRTVRSCGDITQIG